jgi:(p)ppGpp synthase/HD superfamily hydrolase
LRLKYFILTIIFLAGYAVKANDSCHRLSRSLLLKFAISQDKDSQLIRRALRFSKKKHAEQTRKFDGGPYIVHPIRTAKTIGELTNDSEMMAAALLHDTLEDTKTTYRELKRLFGPRVAKLVKELTSEPKKRKGHPSKAEYLTWKMKNMSRDALLIKLADRLDNVSDFEDADFTFISRYRAQTDYILSEVFRERKDLSFLHIGLRDEIYKMMDEGESFFWAKKTAQNHYAHFRRIVDDSDYFMHPFRVAQSLGWRGASKEVKIAAYLKDIMILAPKSSYLEIERDFGKEVADIVFEITQKSRSYQSIGTKALLVNLAGRFDNLKEIYANESLELYKKYIQESRTFYGEVILRTDLSDIHKGYLLEIKKLLNDGPIPTL